MARRRTYAPLRVYLNHRLVGYLVKEPSGAIEFLYDTGWLDWEHAIPISLSLPLREEAYRGQPVIAVFENLLPDSEDLRRHVAEKVGASGSDAYSLLSSIGRDCVGGLQFVPEGVELSRDAFAIEGEKVSDETIEKLLKNLIRSPLGLSRDDDFRISVAGAQEKTALLHYKGHWYRPYGSTPTTHIFKTPIGTLPNGIDLSDSVENEFYCLKLFGAFGLPVNEARIAQFGEAKALVVERFDRRWTKEGRLLRLPQEDCCQALSVPPTQKYQNEGGPGMIQILQLLKRSDSPEEDQAQFLKAQILFWLIGATDGHAKNFSLALGVRSRFSLTPIYDVLTAQPSLDKKQIERKQMKMAMSVGKNRHYRIDEIHGRHFVQTAEEAGVARKLVHSVIDSVSSGLDQAISRVEAELPRQFPAYIHESVVKAMKDRVSGLEGL